MNNNQLPLVTYVQARRLKNAGFDRPSAESALLDELLTLIENDKH